MSDQIEIESAKSVNDLVLKFFQGDHELTLEWLATENILLGGVSPLYMIGAGRSKKLLQFIKHSLEENL